MDVIKKVYRGRGAAQRPVTNQQQLKRWRNPAFVGAAIPDRARA
jgi:hypothetical protein